MKVESLLVVPLRQIDNFQRIPSVPHIRPLLQMRPCSSSRSRDLVGIRWFAVALAQVAIERWPHGLLR